MAQRLRGRPAHPPGPTFFSYTPNGRKLVTVGGNGAFRVFDHLSADEPAIIDVSTEDHLAVVAHNDFFVVGSEDGSVTKYSLATNAMEDVLVRCSLPIRDVAISPDGQWCAVASDELEVKVVNTADMQRVMYLRDQLRPVKAVSFDHSGAMLAVSCTDGVVYVYSLSSEEPQLVKRVDGLISLLESEAKASAKVSWHPDGRAFGAPNALNDFQTVARSDWLSQKGFSGHKSKITASAWSPNGALLATAAADNSLLLWETRTQKILKKYDDVRDVVLALQWHPTDNVVSYTNNNGELFMREDFVPDEHRKLLEIELQPSPLNKDPLGEISGNAGRSATDGSKGKPRNDDAYLDDLLGPDAMSEDEAFIEDDDGAGYAEAPNGNGKRAARPFEAPLAKRPARHANQNSNNVWQPQVHVPFQPGSTPWKGNRRYLCLNLTGFVWTVDQETHNTVTVEFYDRYQHRDFHFTDPYKYDKACLNDKGSLFSCAPSSQHPAVLYYRPHETWTARTDWRTQLPTGEEVTSISLSDSCIVATTSAGYVRIYSLFGVPLKMYRQKSTPAVTCVSWRDYVMTIGNGPIGGDGITRLLYTIENVKRDEICQSEDILALPSGAGLQSVFFSDKGDPCIYDSEGVLLICLHWRTPGQARWVPLLDTKALERLASGKKEESYWPVAVANDKFHCIILKGGEDSPYFPRPLLSEFDFRVPVTENVAVDDDDNQDADLVQQRNLEEQYVRTSLQHSLVADMIEHTNATSAQKSEVPALEREVDKVLLQLLANECREGEERGMKALEIATLMKDRSGQMLTAAGKIASRFQRDILGEKITQLAERRLVGLVDDDEV